MKIMIVEDSRLVVQVLKEMIDKLPYSGKKDVSVYSNAEDALDQMKACSASTLPNLIILDLELPGQHGLEFLQTLKSIPAWRDIPVIVNSTSKKKDDVLGSYKGGALIFLKKDDEQQVFNEVIHALMIKGLLK